MHILQSCRATFVPFGDGGQSIIIKLAHPGGGVSGPGGCGPGKGCPLHHFFAAFTGHPNARLTFATHCLHNAKGLPWVELHKVVSASAVHFVGGQKFCSSVLVQPWSLLFGSLRVAFFTHVSHAPMLTLPGVRGPQVFVNQGKHTFDAGFRNEHVGGGGAFGSAGPNGKYGTPTLPAFVHDVQFKRGAVPFEAMCKTSSNAAHTAS